jgi:hypothetical protein
MSLFVEWDCGCIGLPGVDEVQKKKAVIIEPCDRDHYDDRRIRIGTRDMSLKGCKEVSSAEAEQLLDELCGLVVDGYKLREIRCLLEKPQRK